MIRLRIIRPNSQNLDYISNHDRNERFVITEDKERYARIVLQLIERQPILMLFNLTFATYLLSPTWPRKCSRVLRITKAKRLRHAIIIIDKIDGRKYIYSKL